jgi:D-alanine-D-alanine ligase
MKITVLIYLENAKTTKYDPVADHVSEALRQAGHKASVFAVHGDVRRLTAGLSRRRPDLVFNLMETFGDQDQGAVGLVGLLDLLGLRYTGGGPGEYYLQTDKALAKKLLAFEKIPYPKFAVFSKDSDLETGGNLRLPLFVKPLRMEASIGIDSKSLVHSTRDMMERVLAINKECKDDALAEEYIEGRELYVGVLGNREPVAFPPVEIDFSGMPKDAPHFLDSRAKWDKNRTQYKGTRAVVADVPDELRARLQKVATDAYRALRVRDYGRVDLRLTESGDIYVLEVNASCYLEPTGEFVMGAKAHGLEYPELIDRIANLALERYQKNGSTELLRAGKSRGKRDSSPAQ